MKFDSQGCASKGVCALELSRSDLNRRKIMKWIIRLLSLAVFIVGVALVVIGQRMIGLVGLSIMLVGLAGILLLLYLYNRKYQ